MNFLFNLLLDKFCISLISKNTPSVLVYRDYMFLAMLYSMETLLEGFMLMLTQQVNKRFSSIPIDLSSICDVVIH
jgi:hypothetical protein